MKPKIAIPIGDPAGIGPEISVKALKNKQVYERAICIAIGDKQIIENAMKIVGSFQKLHIIENPKEAVDDGNILNVINISNIDMEKFSFGKVNPMCGRAAYEYIEQAIKLAMDREVDAVTTTTINKEAIKLAGVPYIGHTEIFGALTGTEDPLTLLKFRECESFFYPDMFH